MKVYKQWLLIFAACQAPAQSTAVSRTLAAAHSDAGGTKMADSPILADSNRLNRVQLVLRVVPLGPGQGDKYAWIRVKILAVLKNTSGQQLGSEIEIAYYSGKPGVPADECTVYLEPYNDTHGHPWKLLGGSADLGVSHIGSQSKR